MNTSSLITIVGGGIVGKSACIALANSCYPLGYNGHVLPLHLLDAGPIFSKKSTLGFSNRVSLITPSSVSLFKKLGIWDVILNNHAYPVTKMSIFDSDIPPEGTYESTSSLVSMLGKLCFQQPTIGISNPIGYIVQNHVIESALDEKLLSLEHLGHVILHEYTELVELDKNDWDIPYRIVKFERKNSKNNKEYQSMQTQLLIGADGSQSKTRSLLEIPHYSHDYDHVGIVATLEIESDISNGEQYNDHTAYQRFLSTGPIALLPLSETHMSLVWSVPKSFENTLVKQLTKEQFVTAVDLAMNHSLTDVLYYCLNPGTQVQIRDENCTIPRIIALKSEISSFLMRFGICPRSIAPSSVLIGDAAHVVHPLAGQGLNLGLSDIITLSSLIQEAKKHGLAPSDSVNVLERYSMQRDKRNLAMLSGCHVLFNLFTTRSNFWIPPKFVNIKSILEEISSNGPSISTLDILRRSGLNLLDHLPFIKVLKLINRIL